MGEITVAALLEEWLAWRLMDDYGVTSADVARNAFTYLKADFDGLVTDVRAREVERWYARMSERGKSTAYAIRIAGVLSAAYSQGIVWGYVDYNPVIAARTPKIKTKVHPPSPVDIKAALELARTTDPKGYLFMRVVVVTGMRREEALALRRETFDAATGNCVLRRVAVPVRGGLEIVEYMKTAAGERWVMVDSDTATLISKTLLDHESPWLFPGKDPSRPMHPSTASHKVQRLGQEAGIHLTPHMLRHHVATQAIAAVIPIPVVAHMLRFRSRVPLTSKAIRGRHEGRQ